MSDLTIKNDYLDYQQASFQSTCVRKHLLKDQIYNLYILPDFLVLSKLKQEQKPKYLLRLNLENSIEWLCEGNNDKKHIVAFGLSYQGKTKYFYSSVETLLTIKKLLACKVLYKQIIDFYTAIKCLGNGSSSHVYLVQDINDRKKQYASKCVEKEYIQQDEAGIISNNKKGLVYEIKNIRKLDHPNILKLYEVYEGKQTFYLVMENLEGRSLYDCLIDRQGLGFNNKEIKLIMKEILMGIAYMHQQNMIHRDIKPENIMFSKRNSFEGLKIVDFGLATSSEIDEFLYMKCGTPGYVAPEVANANYHTLKYEKVCDIFSAGVILYKLFTQKDLFPGSSFDEIFKLNRLCKFNLTLLQLYRVPEQGIDLIKKMLEIDPKKRISAEDALIHPFFNEKDDQLPLQVNTKKKNFQQMKNEIQSKPVWNTQQFSPFTSQIQSCQIQSDDQFQIDDNEGTTQFVPSIKSNNMGSFFIKKDLRLIQLNSKQQDESQVKRTFRKYNTTEFDFNRKDLSTKDRIPYHPSFILISNIEESNKSLRNETIHESSIPEEENEF